MVKRILLCLTIICSVYSAKGQSIEYLVENVDDVPSYFYTEKIGVISSLLSAEMRIQVVDNNGKGIPVNVFFINSANFKDTIVILTDSSGCGYLSKKKFETGKFFISSNGNRLNGIKGFVNIKETKKLTIVLGQQSVSKVKIKSKTKLSVENIQMIVNSLREGEYPQNLTGISIEVYIEI